MYIYIYITVGGGRPAIYIYLMKVSNKYIFYIYYQSLTPFGAFTSTRTRHVGFRLCALLTGLTHMNNVFVLSHFSLKSLSSCYNVTLYIYIHTYTIIYNIISSSNRHRLKIPY